MKKSFLPLCLLAMTSITAALAGCGQKDAGSSPSSAAMQQDPNAAARVAAQQAAGQQAAQQAAAQKAAAQAQQNAPK